MMNLNRNFNNLNRVFTSKVVLFALVDTKMRTY